MLPPMLERIPAVVLFGLLTAVATPAFAETPSRTKSSGAAAKAETKSDEAKKEEPKERVAGETAPGDASVVKTRTNAAGEEEVEFQTIEVEGRLKTPQILYFLRRVRAEMRAGQLGHRSFLPELRDTRRSSALR